MSGIARGRALALAALLLGATATPTAAADPSPNAPADGLAVRYRTISTRSETTEGSKDPGRRVRVSGSWDNVARPTVGRVSPRSAGATTAAAAPAFASIAGPSHLQAASGRGGLTDAVSVPGGCGTAHPCAEPPNPSIAVSPTRILQVVEGRLRYTDRSGAILLDTPTDLFRDPGVNQSPTRIRVAWDQPHQRWIAAVQVPTCSFSSVSIWVSRSDDLMTAGWHVVRISQQGIFVDDPAIGISADKIVLSANQYALDTATCEITGYLGASLHIVDWADVDSLDDLVVNVAETAPEPDLFAWRPARNISSTNTLRAFVGIFPPVGSALHLGTAAITGSVAAETVAVSQPVDLSASGKLAAMSGPPDPYQAGTPRRISEPMDERPIETIWQGASLWTSQQVRCRPAGDAVDRSCARVIEYRPGTGLVRQDFLIGAPGSDSYTPSIALAGNGRLFVAWTRSSSATYASPWMTTRDPNDTVNTVRTPAQVGVALGTYQGTRWGENVGMATDPNSTTDVWAGLPYADPFGGWSTWIARYSRQIGSMAGGSLTIAGGAAISTLKPTLGITTPPTGPITLMRLSNVSTATNGVLTKARTYTVRRSIPWNFLDGFTGGTGAQGTRTVYLQFGNGAGTWGPILSDSVVVDTSAPSTPGVPRIVVDVPSTVVAGDVADRLTWTASSDTGTGVARYDFQRHPGSPGDWETRTITTTEASGTVTTDLAATNGGERFRVRAVDGAGNVSAWAETGFAVARVQAFFVTGVEFDPPTGTVGSDLFWTNSCPEFDGECWWFYRPDPGAPGASATYTTIDAEVIGLGAIFTTCPTCGTVEVYADGVLAETIDLYSPVVVRHQLPWIASWATSGTHSITIRAAGPGAGTGHGVPIEAWVRVFGSAP